MSEYSSVYHVQEALTYFESLPSLTYVDIIVNAYGNNLPLMENNEELDYSSRVYGLFNKITAMHKCVICITDSLLNSVTKQILDWCERLDCRYIPYNCKIGVFLFLFFLMSVFFC
jgi:hypothetical protein